MFRFTIRDVLWLMVVAAMAVCWATDRLLLRSMLNAAFEKAAMPTLVSYDGQEQPMTPGDRMVITMGDNGLLFSELVPATRNKPK